MQQTAQLEEQIVSVLAANKVCSFGTVDGDKPKVRYMAMFHEGLTIYLATNSTTDKVDELRDNPNVHVLAGYDGRRSPDILQIQAKAEVSQDQALKNRLWNESFKKWFQGPEDPQYVLLKLTPRRIEYSSGHEEPRVWSAE